MLGQRLALQLVVADYVYRLALGEERVFLALVSLAQNTISELEDRAAHHCRPRLNENLIVVARRRAIAATRLDHRKNAAVIGFEAAVGQAQRAQQFHAAQLKPDQV